MNIKTIKNKLRILRLWHHPIIIGIAVLSYYLMTSFLQKQMPNSFILPVGAKIILGFGALFIGFAFVLITKDFIEEIMQIKHDPIYKKNTAIFKHIKNHLKLSANSCFGNASYWHMQTKKEIHIVVSKFDDNDKALIDSLLSKLNLTYIVNKDCIVIKL
jgi:hypothetical protein